MSKYWQAEMLGIDMAKLQAEREIKPGPIVKMSGSWAAHFERLDYERKMGIAAAARRAKLNPPT
jgi:hypothetical protein